MFLDKISVIWLKNNEKYSLYFCYHFSFFIYIFYFWEYPSCEKWRIFIWETCFVPKYLKTYEKTKYTFPSSWNNLVNGGRAAKIFKQHKRLEKRRKTWYRLDLASTDQRECSEFEASQNARGRLKFDASSLKFDASQRGLS